MSAALAPVIPIRGTLYEIIDHLALLFDAEDIAETDEERAAIQADIARWMEAEICEGDPVAGYLVHCKAQQRFADEEIERLQARKAAFARRYDRIKQCAIVCMKLLRTKRIEGRTSTLTLKPCPASVDITDEMAVPACYKSVTVTVSGETWEWLQPMLPTVTPHFSISKTAIKATIVEEKIEVPGATLITDKMTVVCR